MVRCSSLLRPILAAKEVLMIDAPLPLSRIAVARVPATRAGTSNVSPFAISIVCHWGDIAPKFHEESDAGTAKRCRTEFVALIVPKPSRFFIIARRMIADASVAPIITSPPPFVFVF